MNRYLVAVTLYVRRNCAREFRAFEQRSLAVAARHGAELLAAARLAPEPCDALAPYEFHLLAFPSEAAFLAFREAADSRSLDSERARVIVRSDLMLGCELDVSGSDFASGALSIEG